MDSSTAVSRIYNHPANTESHHDTELWSRVRLHLNADVPLQLVMLRPWRWLNARHELTDTATDAPDRAKATIHYLYPTRTTTQ